MYYALLVYNTKPVPYYLLAAKIAVELQTIFVDHHVFQSRDSRVRLVSRLPLATTVMHEPGASTDY